MAQGVVKVYDPTTGFGVVVLDADQSEVLLRPGSLSGSIFRNSRFAALKVKDAIVDDVRDLPIFGD